MTPEFRREQRFLARHFADHGIPFVDPTEALIAEEARGRRLYHGYDGHFNADGYALMAGLLQQEYVKRGRVGPQALESGR